MRILKTSLLLILMTFLCINLSYAQTVIEYCNKGIEYGTVGDFEKAKIEFKKALEICQSYAPAKDSLKIIEDVNTQKIKKETAIHLFKGINCFKKGMPDEMMVEARKAIEIDPDYAEAHYLLGVAYGNKGMSDEAIFEFKKAIEINPNYAETHFNLGIAYGKKGMSDEAIIEFKKIIEINPDLAEAYNYLGLAYGIKGMLDEAIAEYKKAIEINPNYAEAYSNLAVAYFGKKEYDLAIKYCDKAVELGYKVNPDILNSLEPYRKK